MRGYRLVLGSVMIYGAATALYYHERANVTFRWQRGDSYMFVYRGNSLTGRTGPVVAQVEVPATWVDEAEVRQRAQAWLAEQNGR